MKKEIAVGGRYKSRIGEMFALEDEMEMKSLRESGILDSVNDSFGDTKSAKFGSAIFCGTSGDIGTINSTKNNNEMGLLDEGIDGFAVNVLPNDKELVVWATISTTDKVVYAFQFGENDELKTFLNKAYPHEHYVFATSSEQCKWDIVVLGEFDPAKLIVINVSCKPPHWSWGKFVSIINATRLIPITNNRDVKYGIQIIDLA